MMPRLKGWLTLFGLSTEPSSSISKGIITDFLMKWVVLTTVSACNFLKSCILFIRSNSSSIRNDVRRFGSLVHWSILCPSSLQLTHLTFFSSLSYSCYCLRSSSSSSLLSCLEYLQPGASLPFLPQHHHISPEYSDWCWRQDQLKFSFSLYSLVHCLQVFKPLAKFPFFASNLEILFFSFSLSSCKDLTTLADAYNCSVKLITSALSVVKIWSILISLSL